MARITRRKRSQRGLAMVDTLAATLIITVAMVGTVGVFFSVLNLTQKTVEASTASSLIRKTIEDAKVAGFDALADGTTYTYYNTTGSLLANSTGASFKITQTVTTDTYDADGTPADSALRTILVTAQRPSDSVTIDTTATYLAKNGS